jgi:radical SAM-linked protein
MKVRIKFTKSGPLKFIGHLDVMRYFQKAIRRAEIDVEYSKGYSPHQLMSFAAPLGVGLTSDGEYVDISMHTILDPDIMIKKLNSVMDKNIQVVGFHILSEQSKNAMSIVAAADYLVSLKDGYNFLEKSLFEEKFVDFYKQDSIVIVKKSKKSENEVDIRPSIYNTAFTADEFLASGEHAAGNSDIVTAAELVNNKTVADSYDNNIKVYMQLATGSANNLKPELVMEAFCEYAGLEFNTYAFQVHRIEVYTDLGDQEKRKLIPLDQGV